jgi:hypothetical protein
MSTRVAGALVVAESLIIFIPLIVLGAAIEWPASLDDPADIALPRLLENEATVRFGYLAYLVYSVAILPVGVAVTTWLHRSSRSGPLGSAALVAIGLATVSAGLRTIGIVRWLAAMFPLAERWEAAGPEAREAIAIQFQALNDYGGAIGESLGVSLFAALWVAVTALGPVGEGAPRQPRWIAISGAVVAIVVAAPLVELAGYDSGPLVTVGGTAFNVWLLALGVTMIRQGSRPRRSS